MIFLLPAFLIGAALLSCLLGIWDREKVFINFDTESMSFPAGKESEISEGGSYGIFPSDGPHFNLDPGEYRLKWSDYADGENAFLLSFGNGARIEPSELVMKEGEEEGEFVFRVMEQGVDLKVEVDFRSGTHLALLFLRLYTPPLKDNTITVFLLALAGAVFLAGCRRGWMNRRRIALLCILSGVLFVALAPSLRDGAVIGESGNGMRKLARLDTLADAIRGGRFPEWISHWTDSPFGTCISVFRPDILLLPLALARLAGASAAYMLNLWTISLSLFSAGAVWVLARESGAGRKEATLAMLIFLLMPWRVTAVYENAAFDETAALAFLCLIPECFQAKRKLFLPLCACAVFLACPLFGLVLWTVGIVQMVYFGLKNQREKAGKCALMLLSVPLTAFQWIPMLKLMKTVPEPVQIDALASAMTLLSLAGSILLSRLVRGRPEDQRRKISLLLLLAAGTAALFAVDPLIASRDLLPVGEGSNTSVFWEAYALKEEAELKQGEAAAFRSEPVAHGRLRNPALTDSPKQG